MTTKDQAIARFVEAVKQDRHDWEDWPADSREAFIALQTAAPDCRTCQHFAYDTLHPQCGLEWHGLHQRRPISTSTQGGAMEDRMTIPTARCKLNQLCWVKNAQVQSNIGRIVTTTLYLGYFEAGTSTTPAKTPISSHYWNVKSNSKLDTIYGKEEHEVCLPDSWLQPILPDEDALKYVLRSEPQDESVVEYAKELITHEGVNHG